MKNDNKKKQAVVIVLSILVVCLVAGLFLRTGTAKGTQDMLVQGGEGNLDEQGDGESEPPSTLVPSGNDADGFGNGGEDAENSHTPTPSEGINTKPSDDKMGENLPSPTEPGQENSTAGQGTGNRPESGEEAPGNEEKDETAKLEVSATPEPGEVITIPQATEKPTATKPPEKSESQPEEQEGTGEEKPETTPKEDSEVGQKSPSGATPPPNPPVDGKDTAPVENPDKDGNCRPEHKNPEKGETKKEESAAESKPSKKEEKPSKGESSKKDDSKGEPPSEGAIYVPGFGWVEYEGPNSHGTAPNAGTGDIIGDM